MRIRTIAAAGVLAAAATVPLVSGVAFSHDSYGYSSRCSDSHQHDGHGWYGKDHDGMKNRDGKHDGKWCDHHPGRPGHKGDHKHFPRGGVETGAGGMAGYGL